MDLQVVGDSRLRDRLTAGGQPVLVVPCKWKRAESALALSADYVVLASSGLTGSTWSTPVGLTSIRMHDELSGTVRMYGEFTDVQFLDVDQARAFTTALGRRRAELTAAEAARRDDHPLVLDEYDRLVEGVFLGGAYLGIAPRAEVHLVFRRNRLEVYSAPSQQGDDPLVTLDYSPTFVLDLSGPGTVTTGTNFVASGTSLVGAAESFAISTLLNSMTRKTEVVSIITVGDNAREGFFLNRRLPPEVLRQFLSPAFVQLRRVAGAGGDLVGGLERLAALHQAGLLTTTEFDAAKARLLGED